MFHPIGKSGCSLGANFQSHKRVAAAKITAIQHDRFDDQPVTRLIFDGIPSVTVADSELAHKPVPEAGMYLIVYKDGYFSFHPGESFEEEYHPLGTSAEVRGIGWAVKQLHNGARVCRKCWNGKDMYLELQVPDANSKMACPYVYISISGADGLLVPWNASQTDLLAADWEIAD